MLDEEENIDKKKKNNFIYNLFKKCQTQANVCYWNEKLGWKPKLQLVHPELVVRKIHTACFEQI